MANNNKRVSKKVEKTLKKINTKILAVSLIFLMLGLIFGAFSCYFITKNDTFEIVGEKEITINKGDTYLDKGARAISFGKDVSSDITVEGEVDTSVADVYVIKYKCSNFKYKDIVKVRYVTVVEVE